MSTSKASDRAKSRKPSQLTRPRSTKPSWVSRIVRCRELATAAQGRRSYPHHCRNAQHGVSDPFPPGTWYRRPQSCRSAVRSRRSPASLPTGRSTRCPAPDRSPRQYRYPGSCCRTVRWSCHLSGCQPDAVISGSVPYFGEQAAHLLEIIALHRGLDQRREPVLSQFRDCNGQGAQIGDARFARTSIRALCRAAGRPTMQRPMPAKPPSPQPAPDAAGGYRVSFPWVSEASLPGLLRAPPGRVRYFSPNVPGSHAFAFSIAQSRRVLHACGQISIRPFSVRLPGTGSGSYRRKVRRSSSSAKGIASQSPSRPSRVVISQMPARIKKKVRAKEMSAEVRPGPRGR